MIKRNDTVVLTARMSTWIKRTDDEIAAIVARNRKEGRFLDDGGEPLLPPGTYGAVPFEAMPITVTVTSLRPKWEGSSQRPRFLCAGWCDALKREVLFKNPEPS